MPIPPLKVKSPHSWKKNKPRGLSEKAIARRRQAAWRASQIKRKGRPADRRTAKQGGWQTLKKRLIKLIAWLIAIGGLIILGLFFYYSSQVPTREEILASSEGQSTKIYDRTGKVVLYDLSGDVNKIWIPLDQIPQHVRWALIAMEDDKFYSHHGFDVPALIKAVLHEFLGIGPPRGGSTITQQLVKNVLLSPERTYKRKFKELILAYQLEKKFSKDEILELYFNVVPYGSTAYGIEAAAELYFGKPASQLDLAEGAVLAAMLKATTYYSPYGSHVDELFKRQQIVLDKMAKLGYISQAEAEQAKQEKLTFKKFKQSIKAPHFVMYIKEMLAEKYGNEVLEKGGLKVITSLDWEKQQIAEEAVEQGVERNEQRYGAHNAALASINAKTGEVLAMVGSRDYFNEEYDGAVNVTMRPRQPGSSFKPIVYAAAFIKGFSPKTILFDTLTKFKTEAGEDYEPHNYNDEEHGPVSIRQALAGSLNIPAVKTIYLTGIKNVLDLAERMGYSTFQDRSRFGLSLVLGGGEVKLIEHVKAFAVFANNGRRHNLHYILKVEDKDGKVLEEFKPEDEIGEEVLDANVAKMINSILSDDEARAFVFGRGSKLTLPDRPVAAKTGTTNDYRDGWTIGYTPSIVTGVWVGNNDNSPMKGAAAGGNVAAPIWHEYMSRVLKDSPVEQFEQPEFKELPDKPMLNGEIGQKVVVKIDKASGKLATDLTPPSFIEEKTYQELHCILHYVNKDNILGPIPEHPEEDPQYENWEAAVRKWAEENGMEAAEDLPTEYDDLHVPENKPKLQIISPTNGTNFTQPNLNVQVQVNTPRAISRVEYYLDNQLLETVKTWPYNLSNYQLVGFDNGSHWLRVIAYDDIDNSREKSVKINLSLPAQYSQPVIWLAPQQGEEIFAEQLPYNLKLRVNNYQLYNKADFYYKPVAGGSSVWIGWAEIKSNQVSVQLTDIQGGEYNFYVILSRENGQTVRSPEIRVKIVD